MAILSDGFAGKVDNLVDFQAIEKQKERSGKPLPAKLVEDIAAMLQRRPCPLAEIDKALHVQDLELTRECVRMLVDAGRVEKIVHDEKEFYQYLKRHEEE